MRLLLGPLLRPTNLPQHVSLDLLITPPHEPTHRSIINLSDFILYTGYHWILYHPKDELDLKNRAYGLGKRRADYPNEQAGYTAQSEPEFARLTSDGFLSNGV
ncbi:hypothetical protein TWF569_006827 [Orbilia oligospora]|uniref:Uncharacterized protein n=1 Tax=Orbilia oligospora TaxID=2813651 RepID=A0A7C8NKQ9_ORBOL|nr:hypothetical protein TWF706_006079 [Orbilia oligospora]KAF3107975.1 hypothetical protein TWF102_011461 [Orbilia oligospora]KAF3116557.1 hypothetical protein TWF103_008319 [Orbilia oligospora]KAF3128188.1 hypothetical protein TWF594_011759 [Orbilia oligospora]KAF3135769.1 hypothetical protein TWF703_005864 [Orbilia oligospora]